MKTPLDAFIDTLGDKNTFDYLLAFGIENEDDISVITTNSEHAVILPSIVKESIISYINILQSQKEEYIKNISNDIYAFKEWAESKMNEDKNSSKKTKYSPSKIINKMISSATDELNMQTTEYDDKINELKEILNVYIFED